MDRAAYENILEVTGLEKSYHVRLGGDKEKVYPVLRGINLEVKRGEFVSIMGRPDAARRHF